MGEVDLESFILQTLDRSRNVRQQTTLLVYLYKLNQKRSSKLRTKTHMMVQKLRVIYAQLSPQEVGTGPIAFPEVPGCNARRLGSTSYVSAPPRWDSCHQHP